MPIIADRHVDEEIPVPGEIGGDEAADQRPHGRSEHARQHVIAHRLHELVLGKGAGEDQPADGRHHRAAEALEDSAEHELRASVSESPHRTEPSVKMAMAEQNTGPRAETVGDPAADRNEDREADEVGGDRRAHLRRRDGEALRHLGQRGRDDRRIEPIHEERAGDGDRHDQRHFCLRGFELRCVRLSDHPKGLFPTFGRPYCEPVRTRH